MSAARILAVSLMIVAGNAPTAYADDTSVSKIRKAAIERMQGRLGGLRGSITYQERIVMLTNKLIEMQKPVRQPTHVRGSRGFDTLTTASTLPSIDAKGSFYSIKRQSRHSGFTSTAGTLPMGPEDEIYPLFSRDFTNHHGL